MAFDLESLEQKVNERLWNWKARMEGAGVGLVYYFLSATALYVIAETVRAGDAASLTTALGAIGGSLLVSQDKSLQVVLDEVVEKLDVLSQAEQKLDQEADRQWFADTIREELANLGSTVRYKVKLGDRAVMGVSNSQVNTGDDSVMIKSEQYIGF